MKYFTLHIYEGAIKTKIDNWNWETKEQAINQARFQFPDHKFRLIKAKPLRKKK